MGITATKSDPQHQNQDYLTREPIDLPPLPLDVWKLVLFKLTEIQDVISFVSVSKDWRSLGDDLFWKRLYEINQRRFEYAHPKQWSFGIPFDYGSDFKMLSEETQATLLDLKKQSWKRQFLFWYRQDLITALKSGDRIVINQLNRGCRTYRAQLEYSVHRSPNQHHYSGIVFKRPDKEINLKESEAQELSLLLYSAQRRLQQMWGSTSSTTLTIVFYKGQDCIKTISATFPDEHKFSLFVRKIGK